MNVLFRTCQMRARIATALRRRERLRSSRLEARTDRQSKRVSDLIGTYNHHMLPNDPNSDTTYYLEIVCSHYSNLFVTILFVYPCQIALYKYLLSK